MVHLSGITFEAVDPQKWVDELIKLCVFYVWSLYYYRILRITLVWEYCLWSRYAIIRYDSYTTCIVCNMMWLLILMQWEPAGSAISENVNYLQSLNLKSSSPQVFKSSSSSRRINDKKVGLVKMKSDHLLKKQKTISTLVYGL